jgi:hypothetical protein
MPNIISHCTQLRRGAARARRLRSRRLQSSPRRSRRQRPQSPQNQLPQQQQRYLLRPQLPQQLPQSEQQQHRRQCCRGRAPTLPQRHSFKVQATACPGRGWQAGPRMLPYRRPGKSPPRRPGQRPCPGPNLQWRQDRHPPRPPSRPPAASPTIQRRNWCRPQSRRYRSGRRRAAPSPKPLWPPLQKQRQRLRHARGAPHRSRRRDVRVSVRCTHHGQRRRRSNAHLWFMKQRSRPRSMLTARTTTTRKRTMPGARPPLIWRRPSRRRRRRPRSLPQTTCLPTRQPTRQQSHRPHKPTPPARSTKHMCPRHRLPQQLRDPRPRPRHLHHPRQP